MSSSSSIIVTYEYHFNICYSVIYSGVNLPIEYIYFFDMVMALDLCTVSARSILTVSILFVKALVDTTTSLKLHRLY